MDNDSVARSVHPLWTVLLAVGGFLLGLGIMRVGADTGQASRAFAGSFSGKLWILLIAAQVSFWAVVAIPLWSALRAFQRTFRQELEGSRIQSFLFAGIFLALLSLSPRVLPTINDPLTGHTWKIPLISAVGVLSVGLPALVAMFWVRVVAVFPARHQSDEDGSAYVYLRESLQRLMRLLGATIALSTLSTGALQQALTVNAGTSNAFPSELVLLWGAGATVLLMLVYAPAYLALRALGYGLIARLLPMPALGSNDWFDWDGRRKSLTGFLQLEQNLLDRLQAGIFILAPLLSAAVSVAIPH
jgi:hypothetical protein